VSVYVEVVRSALEELADADYQRRVWTGRGGADEMSSFEECFERLFGDSGLGLALEHNQPVFGSGVDGNLQRLSDLLARIDGRRSPAKIVQDPAMERVRELASEVLLALDDTSRSGVI
jgi:hypothetical protein